MFSRHLVGDHVRLCPLHLFYKRFKIVNNIYGTIISNYFNEQYHLHYRYHTNDIYEIRKILKDNIPNIPLLQILHKNKNMTDLAHSFLFSFEDSDRVCKRKNY